MIEVRFERDRERGLFAMELIGHAGFAQLGKDPVCAGASVLAMTTVQCVKTMEEAGQLRKKAHIVIRLFRVAETGMRLLTEAYPGYITIRSGE